MALPVRSTGTRAYLPNLFLYRAVGAGQQVKNIDALTFAAPTISATVALVNYGPLTDTVYFRDSYDNTLYKAQPGQYLVTYPNGRTFIFSAANYTSFFS